MNPPEPKPARDEKVFLGIVGIGLCVVACVTIFIFSRLNPELFLRHHHTELKDSGTLIHTNEARALIDFNLVERNGSTVTRVDLVDKFVIVNFIHTSCSITCLEVNYRMAEIQKAFEKTDDVKLVSLTVDPVSDTPDALTKFASKFDADPKRWLFLTGDQPHIYSLIEKSFLGKPDPKLIGFVPGGWASSESIAIVDQQGRIRATFNGMKKETTRKIIDLVEQLRSEPR